MYIIYRTTTMAQRIILAFDKFKGSLSSEQVAAAFKQGWQSVVPDSDIVTVPIADGGDGLLQSLATALGASTRSVVAHDPLGRSLVSRMLSVQLFFLTNWLKLLSKQRYSTCSHSTRSSLSLARSRT